ncbi:MAG: hypothetical protein WCF04_02230 [Candidatus Nanopelagicales bacterium]
MSARRDDGPYVRSRTVSLTVGIGVDGNDDSSLIRLMVATDGVVTSTIEMSAGYAALLGQRLIEAAFTARGVSDLERAE